MIISTTTGSIAFITKITAEFFSLMDSSDVHIPTSTLCEGSFTKVTVEFFTLMDSSDVHISTSSVCV